MKIKKITAAVMAAAVLAAAAPVMGVLPNPLSVTASAAEYQAGDVFYAFLAKDGTDPYIATAEEYEADSANLYGVYQCTVKSDGTIKIGCHGAVSPYPQFGKTLTIPREINGYTVTELGLGEFTSWNGDTYQCSFATLGCKKVVIPDTVTTIGVSAFQSNCFLEEVEFGENSGLKLIDKWAFQDCRSLKSITIPAGVEKIMVGAFGNTADAKLDEFYDRDQNTDLDFTDTYSLTTVNFAKGSKLKLLDQWAFQDQKALKSITLPDSLEKIGYAAFINCTALTAITIPKNVDEIGDGIFAANNGNVMKIAEINVDENNKNFKSADGIVFSKDGKTIVLYPAAKSGKKYNIPKDVNKIAETAFANCLTLTSVTVPEGVTEIPENAFSYCTALAEVKLPGTLTTIAKWGFEATALTSIDIPESVTAIDAHAFESSSLKVINGTAGSYAETFAKENGYTFKVSAAEKPDDTSNPTDTSNTFTDSSADKAADIEVIAKPNVIPKKAQFSVRLDDANSTADRIAYNCYFTYNGAEYEPTDTVTVRIPVPVAMRDIANTLKVYHLQDGKYVNMSAKVDNGYLVFDTDHFSTYIVTADNLADTESSNSTVTPGDTDKNSGGNSGNNFGNDQANTGIALAAAPVILACAAVIAVSKKKK